MSSTHWISMQLKPPTLEEELITREHSKLLSDDGMLPFPSQMVVVRKHSVQKLEQKSPHVQQSRKESREKIRVIASSLNGHEGKRLASTLPISTLNYHYCYADSATLLC
eukprot:1323218-Rhodomonas_salina.1